MSIRFDASGEGYTRALSGFDISAFTFFGWGQIMADRGSAGQPILGVEQGSNAPIYFHWDVGMYLGSYVASPEDEDFATFASRPAVNDQFAWYVRSTSGGMQAGWRRQGDSSWVTVNISVPTGATFTGATALIGRTGSFWTNRRQGAFYIYDSALSDSELNAQMAQLAPVKTTWAWYPFNNATLANNATDSSGNGRNLTQVGTPSVEADVPTSYPSTGISGTLSQTLQAASASATGSLAVRGSLSQSLGALVASGAGSLANSGVLAAALGSLTSVAAGSVAMRGQVSTALEAATLAATGGSSNSGVLSQTLAALTSSGAGSLSVSGSLAATLGNVSISATSVLAITAASSVTLAGVTLSATGETGEQEPIEGVLNATLGSLTLGASGTVEQPRQNFTSSGSSTTWSHKTASRIAREAERARKKHRQVRPIIARQVATIFGGTAQAQAAAQEAVAMELPKSGPVTAESVARALMQAQLILEMQDEEDTFLLLAAA